LELRFVGPYVFGTEDFPEPRLSDPLYAEAVLGRYWMETQFYDRDYKPVTRAEKPGRYGAVIRIHTEDGRTIERYSTFFRTAKPFVWWKDQFKGELSVPEAFGIDPKVAETNFKSIHEIANSALSFQNETLPDLSLLMAGLYESKPDAPAPNRF